MTEQTEITFAARLAQHPMLKARFEAILDIAANAQGDLIQADRAEQRTIEQMRQLGHEVLQDWAKQRIAIGAEELKKKEKNVVGNGQKK
jgi:hypothetical protein